MAYTFQPTKQTVHQFSPLIVEYDRLAEVSENYKDKVDESPVLKATLKDHFLTKMKYSHKYTSPVNFRNPIYVSATVTEASNLLTLGYDLLGMKKKEAFFKVLRNSFRAVSAFSSTSAHVGMEKDP